MNGPWSDPDPDEAYRFFREGYDKQIAGAIDEAIDLYQKSLEIMPTAEAHTFLGWAYSYANRYDAAIEECKKAIEIDPDYGNPYNDIGSYLIEKGEMNDAIPWLERAIEAKRYESYCYPHYNLGRIWEHKGYFMRALECYETALKDNPEYSLAQRGMTRMRGMFN